MPKQRLGTEMHYGPKGDFRNNTNENLEMAILEWNTKVTFWKYNWGWPNSESTSMSDVLSALLKQFGGH